MLIFLSLAPIHLQITQGDDMIREATTFDAQAITDIYNHYIVNTTATFEEDTVQHTEMQARMQKVHDCNLPWLVCDDGDSILGYAYATKWKERKAYRYAVEITVYLSPTVFGKGLGTELYQALFQQLKQRSIHTVIAGITLPNPASVGLHEKLGLSKVAHFQQVGFKFQQWLDVGYWQRKL